MFQKSNPVPIYLDYAATTPLLPQARDAWLHGAAIWANPSSPHAPGRAARAALEEARARVKSALGWEGEVVFTSGASEALALAIGRSKAPLEAVSAVEHDAVLRLAGDAPRLAVDACGRVNPDSAALAGLVVVQQVNSETGVLQDLAAIAEAVRGAGGVLLADCAQGAGKRALPDADLIALSAHKFGGPIGVGALLVRDWNLLHPTGGQERGYRAGTENLPGVLAMAAALEAGSEWTSEAKRLREILESAITQAGGEVVAVEAARSETVGSYRMQGKSANAQLIRFDAMGIAVSAGSACSSGSLKTSHVLKAMDYPHPSEVIRVSMGRETTEAEIDRFIAAWKTIAGVGVKA
ncbi:cysteine desulfurase family protein [Novosphingobium mangrovi (ex Huang et al. 2023)]|uniref:Cysteine desulfurase n=1 Tax=Novosphingobium mangrovi (ex Huang et al. 2023) TaxID=2976432 RepID=A0ABT2I3L8_9SPHN|nr:aminotransferase class V-fold PLP-dependent enzyme [Novosphingobium mangrovi (ex Huang et al. 2023)]MCT2399395.1 aminotransferase class V-fold PLP-dependent enzyme [Novosphingobium mangrovi (ex Huang et al. 2023)]